ncbi:MAG: hypothetical protein L3K10_00530 [Thermoplasmata archaeon]|nr:hypothetical protein [Thermoplasmata archaeon]
MTPISAPHSAREGANSFPPTAHVRVPGSARTYEVREALRGMGLRWDPVSHAWHGTLPVVEGSRLARELGRRPQIVPTIEAFASRVAPEAVLRPPARPREPVRPRIPHDASRTRAEARLALPDADQDEEDGVDSRRFSLLETTSGLPDDSRDADERAAARNLRDVRARVKAARALVATSPAMSETLSRDGRSAVWFYAQFGINLGQFRLGAAQEQGGSVR